MGRGCGCADKRFPISSFPVISSSSSNLGATSSLFRPAQDYADDDPNEVLVDDFDGQCCRTYPYNHSKIRRWRQEREERRRRTNMAAKEPKLEPEPSKPQQQLSQKVQMPHHRPTTTTSNEQQMPPTSGEDFFC